MEKKQRVPLRFVSHTDPFAMNVDMLNFYQFPLDQYYLVHFLQSFSLLSFSSYINLVAG